MLFDRMTDSDGGIHWMLFNDHQRVLLTDYEMQKIVERYQELKPKPGTTPKDPDRLLGMSRVEFVAHFQHDNANSDVVDILDAWNYIDMLPDDKDIVDTINETTDGEATDTEWAIKALIRWFAAVRNRKALLQLCSDFDDTKAHDEGWELVNTDNGPRIQDIGTFASDQRALEFVQMQARFSPYHRRALDLHNGIIPEEPCPDTKS